MASLEDLVPDIAAAVAQSAREAAAEIMTGLGDEGPAWSGDLRDSWTAVPIGGARQTRAGVGEGDTSKAVKGWPYSANDVPSVSIEPGQRTGGSVYRIENTAPHAPYALDLEPGKFFRPSDDPIPEKVDGWVQEDVARPEQSHLRGDQDPSRYGEWSVTADDNWYENFASGQGVQEALAQGVTRGLRAANRFASSNRNRRRRINPQRSGFSVNPRFLPRG